MGAAVGALALVLAGAAGCGSDSSPGASADAPAKGKGGPPSGYTAPDKIGTLTKAADQSDASKAAEAYKKETDVKDSTATVYEDSADKTYKVVVTGLIKSAGEVPKDSDIDQLLLHRADPDSGNKPVAVGGGSVGGSAKCIDSSSGKYKSVECAWINERALLLFRFVNYDMDAAKAHVPPILTATVEA